MVSNNRMHCSSLQPGAATTFCRVTCRFIDLTEMSETRDEFKARLSTGQPGAPPRPVAQFEAPVQIWKCPREMAQHDSPRSAGKSAAALRQESGFLKSTCSGWCRNCRNSKGPMRRADTRARTHAKADCCILFGSTCRTGKRGLRYGQVITTQEELPTRM